MEIILKNNTKEERSASSTPWSLPKGQLLRRSLRSDPTREYMLYVPSRGGVNGPVLVSVQGNSALWAEQVAAFVPACERLGVTLLAPGVAGPAYAQYQRLGRDDRRADVFLDRCLQEVGLMTGADPTRLKMVGYSGGAQFAHRYVMAHPHRIEAAVVVAADWYTFPDTSRRFPYGIRPTRRLPGVLFNPEAYLRVPVTVLVGADDMKTDRLRTSPRIAAQQGSTRVERARRWVGAMQTQAAAHGMPSQVSFVDVPGVGHAFTELCASGHLIERVCFALFGDSSTLAGERGGNWQHVGLSEAS